MELAPRVIGVAVSFDRGLTSARPCTPTDGWRDTAAECRATASGDDDTASVVESLAAMQKRLDELAEMLMAGEIGRQSLTTARKCVEQQKKEAQRALAATTRSRVLIEHLGKGSDLRKEWPTFSLDRQRAVVRSILSHVEVGPAIRGRNTFDPGRITAHWTLCKIGVARGQSARQGHSHRARIR